jgi:hypothetical protein
MVVTCHFVDSN